MAEEETADNLLEQLEDGINKRPREEVPCPLFLSQSHVALKDDEDDLPPKKKMKSSQYNIVVTLSLFLSTFPLLF